MTIKIFLVSVLSSVLCAVLLSSGFVYAKSSNGSTLTPLHLSAPDYSSNALPTSSMSAQNSAQNAASSISSIISSAAQNSKNVVSTLPTTSSYMTNFSSIVDMSRQQAQIPSQTLPQTPHSAGQSLIADITSPPTTYDEQDPPMHIAHNNPQALFNYYADLALIKEIIPDEVFRVQILPLVQTAFKNAPQNQITHEDWRVIEKKILSLKASHGVDYPALFLSYIEKKSLSDSMNTMIDQMGEDMDALGEDLSNEFQKFIDKNKGFFSPKEENRETDNPPTQNTQSM